MSDPTDRQTAINELIAMREHIDAKMSIVGQIAYDMAIEALRQPSVQPDTDEWCHDCKEYDQEHHCCPRWNRVIKTTLEEAQPDKAYEKGWEEGREALRKEIWENERDRLD